MNLLFVCTGNTCRSPMAEAITRAKAMGLNPPIEVRSAGIAAVGGQRMTPQAVKAVKELGIDGGAKHVAQSVSQELLEWADLVLTMTRSHRAHLLHIFPEQGEKVHTLKGYLRRRSIEQHDGQVVDMLLERMAGHRQDMTEEEQEQLEKWQAQWTALETEDIADPFGGTAADYRRCVQELAKEIEQLFHLLQEGPLAES